MSAIVNVSPSVLNDVVACKTRAWVRHVLGYTSRGDAIAALAGQAIHAGIATYLMPSWAEHESTLPHRVEAALAKFHVTYDERYATLSPDQLEPQYTPQNLHRVLARWLEMHPPAMLPWARVLEVETARISRTWDIDGVTVNLVCRPDAVIERADGKVAQVDTKTTGWRIDDRWKMQFRTAAQMTAYVDAMIQRYGDKAQMGGYVNAIHIQYISSDRDKVCSQHKRPKKECENEQHGKTINTEIVEVMREPEMVERWAADAHEAAIDFLALTMLSADKVDGIPMDGAFNGACRFCPMLAWCDARRPVRALDDFLVYDPWVVEEGTR